MQVRDIMTKRPACCTEDSSVQEVAQMMLENDCGEIPVVDDVQTPRPIGVVTDRDLAIRVVAAGKNSKRMHAGACMTSPCVSVTPDDEVETCCKVMQYHRVRRVVVIDQAGACCGIVAQADIARNEPPEEIAEVVREVSSAGD